MEESKSATQVDSAGKTGAKDSAESQANEATGDASSQMPNKPTTEAEARYKRMKLFDKVMQKSLNKFIEDVR